MAAEVLITAVLLLGWMEPGLMVDKFDILEFYAGKARVSRAAREAGLSVVVWTCFTMKTSVSWT